MLGIDPTKEFLIDQAASLTSYVNIWVRKSWDSVDFPEWTYVDAFTPDANHMVPYLLNGAPGGFGPSYFENYISRVFKVFLVDPRLVQGAIDTPFKLRYDGIHCGFEHGTTVWIKYITNPPPQFSSDEWNPGATYSFTQPTYSPVSGESYISVTNNNTGNDPSSVYTAQWQLVPFPFALVDTVLQGVYADCLKEWGQNEKAQAEEQLAEKEGAARAGAFLAPEYSKLTDQAQPKPRYTLI
jgi:hypothetical protein